MFNIIHCLNLALVFNCLLAISASPAVNSDIVGLNGLTLNSRLAPIEGLSEGEELPVFDVRFDALPSYCIVPNASLPINCQAATACTRRTGFYYIQNKRVSNDVLLVECNAHADGGDWTVIQRRLDGSESFFRTWNQYKTGFGEIEGEFFIGLDKLYALTNFDGRQELLILFERNDQITAYAKYSSFAIGNETDRYILKRVGRYNGTAGDALQPHVGSRFSTMDQDNGNINPNAAITFSSAWWYNTNRLTDLNGLWGKTDGRGIYWSTWHVAGKHIKGVQMMIRRLRV